MPAKPSARSALTTLPEELGGAEFGDERLSRRLGQMIEAAIKNPAKSFPQMAKSDAELEGTYRFLNNEAVTPDRILAPHRRATCERIAVAGIALVLHDTSTFTFGGEERGEIGWVSNQSVGFLGHFALAVTADVDHRPLGVMGMSTISRPRNPLKKSDEEYSANPEKEYLRWGAMVDAVEDEVGKGRVIHVMDRAADSYELMVAMVNRGARFVIRMAQERPLVPTWGNEERTLTAALAKAEDVFERDVPLSPRPGGRTKISERVHPPRAGRIAKLHVRAAALMLKRPGTLRYSKKPLPGLLAVNVVEVYEVDPPPGEAPIEWRLVTNEPVALKDQVAAVVDHYRGRWVIEEFFKALKTGCAAEERQLESKRGMLNAIAVLAPVAWRLLTLRTLSRHASDSPATAALTPLQLRLLQAISVRVKLGRAPTVREAMLAVAGLGGHLKRNGEPGWLTLTRGFHELLVMEAGCIAEKLSRGRELRESVAASDGGEGEGALD